MAKKVLIVMLVMAVAVTSFGVGVGTDFFATAGGMFNRVLSIANPLLDSVKYLFVGDMFEPDDYIDLARYYFDDGHYCDIGKKVSDNFWIDSFYQYQLVYSSNEKVVRFNSFRVTDLLTFQYSFVNSVGDSIYKTNIFTTRYRTVMTYYEYCLDYKNNPSTDGWTEYVYFPEI